MLKWFNNKKKDNKGFSLVELIIVVAIMAILVGLLAPQYIKYVEKSRKSADASNLSEVIQAIQVYAADADSGVPQGGYKITISTTGTKIEAGEPAPTDSAAVTTITNEVKKTAPDFESTKLKSNKWDSTGDTTSISATVVVKPDGGTTVSYEQKDLATFMTGKK